MKRLYIFNLLLIGSILHAMEREIPVVEKEEAKSIFEILPQDVIGEIINQMIEQSENVEQAYNNFAPFLLASDKKHYQIFVKIFTDRIYKKFVTGKPSIEALDNAIKLGILLKNRYVIDKLYEFTNGFTTEKSMQNLRNFLAHREKKSPDEFFSIILFLAENINQELIDIKIPHLKFKYEFTPLIAAIQQKKFDAVKQLIESGADIEARDSSGNTPLLVAIAYGDKKIIDFLIDKGANINVTNISEDNPLIGAIYRDDLELVKLLVEKGASKEIIEGTLQFARAFNKEKFIKYLDEILKKMG